MGIEEEYPPDTYCRCGHQLAEHKGCIDHMNCCNACESCYEFDVEPSAESLRAYNRGD